MKTREFTHVNLRFMNYKGEDEGAEVLENPAFDIGKGDLINYNHFTYKVSHRTLDLENDSFEVLCYRSATDQQTY